MRHRRRLKTKSCGIIALNSESQPLYVSRFARQLLERYFAGERREANSLPENLNVRLKQAAAICGDDFALPPAPLRISNSNGDLMIRLMFNRECESVNHKHWDEYRRKKGRIHPRFSPPNTWRK